jgi:hypothetical protein
MSTPRWAVGMQRLGPGVYVDTNNNLHLYLPEILENAGKPATPENLRTLARAAEEMARQEFGPHTEITEAKK